MALLSIFDNASSIMTLVSFITFMGILLWSFALKCNDDFAAQAALPFADEYNNGADGESSHG